MTASAERLTRIELANIKRRLDRWELPHLRELASQQCLQIDAQATRIADLERALAYAESCAECWQRDCFQLQEEIEAQGGHLTLQRNGQVGAVLPAAIHTAAALGARVLL